MRKGDERFVTLVEAIRNINVLNLTLIFTMLLSYFNVNKYVSFILVMLIALIITNVTQKTIIKYLGNKKSLFQSKFLVIVTILFNMAFMAYYYLEKEYGMMILLVLFSLSCLIWRKIMNRKNYNKCLEKSYE